MPTDVNDKIRKLSPSRCRKVKARAAQLTADEEKLITAYERGKFEPVKDQKEVKQTALQAAKRYKLLLASVLSGNKEG